MSSISQLKGQILRAPGSQTCTCHEDDPSFNPKTWSVAQWPAHSLEWLFAAEKILLHQGLANSLEIPPLTLKRGPGEMNNEI